MFAKVQRAKVQRAKVQRAKVQRVKMQRAKVQRAKVQRAKMQRATVQRAKVQRAKVQRTKDRCSPSAEQFEFRTAARNVSRNGLNVYLFNGYERHTTKKCRKRKKKETCFRSFFSLLSIFLLRERERVEKKSERESERGALKQKA